MDEIRTLQLLERAAAEATAWHWGNVDFPSAEASIRQGSVEFAESLGETLGMKVEIDLSITEEAIQKLDSDISAHIESLVKKTLQKAESAAKEEQSSHIVLMTKLQEHARTGRELLKDMREGDPASYEAFKKITGDFDKELMQNLQEFHLVTLEFIFSQTMAEDKTVKELAKMYEVSLEINEIAAS